MEDEPNSQLPYRVIFEAAAAPRTETLAPLDKTDFEDGDYQIWSATQDQRQHFSFDKIIFHVDNITPKVKIMTPQASERVLKRINISAFNGNRVETASS